MAVVQAECPRCGVVRLFPSTVWIYEVSEKIRFECPSCREVVMLEVKPDVVVLLKQFGAKTVAVPAAITTDDLLDFHENIEVEINELLE